MSVRGLVTVEARGFSVERLISAAALAGIPVRDVTRDGGAWRFTTTPAGFRALKGPARKTATRLGIAEKRGLPFLLRRYRGRWALGLGLLFFIAGVYGASLFVWSVGVEGAERIERGEVISFLYENGLKFGAFRGRIDTKDLERRFLARFPDAAWAHIEAGTSAVLRMAETIPAAEVIDRDTPADLVARADGLVTSVTVSGGTPMVKRGDVVQKGDLLVSSELDIGTEDTGFTVARTRARAEVWAKRYYETAFAVSLRYSAKKYTGKTMRAYSIMVMGRVFELPRLGRGFDRFDAFASVRPLFGSGSPAALETREFREYAMEARERTVEEAKALAEAVIDAKAAREMAAGAVIDGKAVAFEEDGAFLRARAVVTIIERIEEERAVGE